jgi:riboflavin kinase/FMN adenylyltransferase
LYNFANYKHCTLKIYHHLDQFTRLENAVVTTGTFDGVHIGHKKILHKLREVAHEINGESVLLTFHPHPRQILQPDMSVKLITGLQEKISLLEQSGLDHLIIHPFTKDFSRTTSQEFIRNILVERIGARKLVIGYDHHFGRNREGSFTHLKAHGPTYGFEVSEIPAQDIDAVAVSSTKIRAALEAGDIRTANQYLGHAYRVLGEVVSGQQLGRQLGYPTANIAPESADKLFPADGVYAVQVFFEGVEKSLPGMCNIGCRPTVSGRDRTLEVFLFDFESDLYGQILEVHFVDRIREEQKFPDLEALKARLQADEQAARKLLGI